MKPDKPSAARPRPWDSRAARPELRIFQVGDVLLSPDILTCFFCCDLSACGGACCVEGDSGAPLTLDEAVELERLLPVVSADLDAEARAVIDRQGVAFVDCEGDLVTSIAGGKDCVFTCRDAGGCRYCAVEKAFRAGRAAWRKPVSCALYPIREKRLPNGLVALNYHRWDICRAAVRRGEELALPVYEFLREPLTRRFGQAWYEELARSADELRAAGLL